MAEHLLEVRNLSVEFHVSGNVVKAVQNVSWHLERGEVLAILGESGSGKSVSASAVTDLIDCPPGRITSGEIFFGGRDLLKMSHAERREINGKRIAMIFQDPLSHLNPVYTVGWQLEETMIIHGMPKAEAKAKALELLTRVGIPEPAEAIGKYPHQFSGGQRQRVMIAMALALEPDVLIADEPTTALDVTVQAQILSLLEKLQRDTGTGLLLITHDLGVVADIADRVVVMQHGKVVEQGVTREVYKNPQHAYTKALIAAAPGKGDMSSVALGSARAHSRDQGTVQNIWPVPCAERRQPRTDGGRVRGHCRRERLRQINARQDAAAAGGADIGRGDLQGAQSVFAVAGGDARPAPRNPDGVSGPDAESQSAHVGL